MAPLRISTLMALVLPLIRIAAASQGLEQRDLLPQSTLPGIWSYKGCYSEINVGRTLPKDSIADTATMNATTCISYCSGKGYPYAGTEYSSQCWCGVSTDPGSTKLNDTACDMPCTGASTQQCGGPGKLTVYWSGSSGPSTNPGIAPWSFVSCFTEGLPGQRTLTKQINLGGPVTVNLCTSGCLAAGYALAGLEYASQCFCGNATVAGGAPAISQSDCNMPCAGNASEWCGGPDRLNLYQLNNAFNNQATPTNPAAGPTPTAASNKAYVGNYQYFGCQTEGNGTRALTFSAAASDMMTLELCQQFCSGSKYFGTEYGRECYCGNTFSQGSVAVDDGNCTMVCNGNRFEYCGNGNRLSVYAHGS